MWEQVWIFSMDLMEHGKKIVLLSAIPTLAVIHWLIAIPFLVFDLTQWSKFLQRYKIQPEANNPVSGATLLKAIGVVLFNQVITNMLVICSIIFLLNECDWWDQIDSATVPSFPRLLIYLVAFATINEVVFYYNHRLLTIS